MNKFMKSKFKGTCNETGKSIAKGEPILYDTVSRNVYCKESQKYKSEWECGQTASYVQAQEDAYWDNLCRQCGL